MRRTHLPFLSQINAFHLHHYRSGAMQHHALQVLVSQLTDAK